MIPTMCGDKVCKISRLEAIKKMSEDESISCIALFAVFEIKASKLCGVTSSVAFRLRLVCGPWASAQVQLHVWYYLLRTTAILRNYN